MQYLDAISHQYLADKKELLVKARYNELAEHGGRGAVNKAIAKKQKKIEQKEKKSRPFSKDGKPRGDGAVKRRFSSTEDQGGRANKRRKIS